VMVPPTHEGRFFNKGRGEDLFSIIQGNLERFDPGSDDSIIITKDSFKGALQ